MCERGRLDCFEKERKKNNFFEMTMIIRECTVVQTSMLISS